MHKGMRMMLEALGIHIDPAEVESLFIRLKNDLPALAQYFERQFSSISERLDRIERILGSIEDPDERLPVKKEATNGSIGRQRKINLT